jgi:hypothetical protein
MTCSPILLSVKSTILLVKTLTLDEEIHSQDREVPLDLEDLRIYFHSFEELQVDLVLSHHKDFLLISVICFESQIDREDDLQERLKENQRYKFLLI